MSMPSVLEGKLSLPVIASPLFIVSGPELVIAQCKAGVVGSFPSLNARPLAQLDDWLTRIKSELTDYAAKKSRKEGGAVRSQPNRPSFQQPVDG